MIRHLTHQQVDKKKWDEAVHSSANSLVYAMSWYLDIVSPGWEALVKDDYASVFPLSTRKKFGIKYLYQPAFTQQLGIFSPVEIQAEEINEFLTQIPSAFRLVEINLNEKNITPKAKGFKVHNRRTFHLPLDKSHEQLVKEYSQNTSRTIRKFEKSGSFIASGPKVKDIADLFLKNKGKEIRNFGQPEREILIKLCDELERRGLLECLHASGENGELTAGAIFIKSKDRYIFLFSGTGEMAKSTGAMSALIDNFISRHAGEGMILDFEGSMDDNLARFYKSFGSSEVVYLQLRKNALPPPLRWFK